MINFLRFRAILGFFSITFFVIFASLAFYKYSKEGRAFTYSIDFTGGTQILLRFDKSISATEVIDVMIKNGWESPTVRMLSDTEVLIRVQDFSSDSQGLGDRIRLTIDESLPDYSVVMLESEAVGPGVGETLRWKSIRAVLIALLTMLLYIGLRFRSFAFATGAVVALFHDAVVILSLFFFFDLAISINVIGAILAVLGYSINDTIVIFSQIRKNIKEMPNTSLADIVNTSLNTTFRRTILTSVSTGLPVLVMLLFGGKALFDFSLALLTGVVFGTYSSIYIASPIMMLLYKEDSDLNNE